MSLHVHQGMQLQEAMACLCCSQPITLDLIRSISVNVKMQFCLHCIQAHMGTAATLCWYEVWFKPRRVLQDSCGCLPLSPLTTYVTEGKSMRESLAKDGFVSLAYALFFTAWHSFSWLHCLWFQILMLLIFNQLSVWSKVFIILKSHGWVWLGHEQTCRWRTDRLEPRDTSES